MTLQEAIRSSKPFKRPCWSNQNGNEPWLYANSMFCQIKFENTQNPWTPKAEDISATDWEVKEPVELWLIMDETGRVVRNSKHFDGTNLPRNWKRVFVREAEAPPPF